MSRPTVDVIVPCYNYADLLEGCVDSVLSQRGVDVRVLIIDDLSPDRTPEVAQRIVGRDRRVEYRRHTVNQGLIGTANEGLEWASADYVVLLSADDLLVPDSLARATSVMEAAPEVGLVYGRPLLWDGETPPPAADGRWRGAKVWPGHDWIRLRCRTGHNCISSPEVVVRTSVHKAVGGYDARCTHTSDLNMWLRIAAVSDIAYVRGVPQAIYRVHADSMLRSGQNPLRDLTERRLAFDCFFASATFAGAPALHDLASRALARQALWRASRAIDRNLLEGPDAVPVDELIAFAHDVHPAASRLPEWRGFRLRRRLGAGRSSWFPPFLATGAAHRLKGHVGQLRWRATGL